MPAYKDDKQNSWYCQFYYEDWQGTRKKKKKRGFKTKKKAIECAYIALITDGIKDDEVVRENIISIIQEVRNIDEDNILIEYSQIE